jgi:hypothetical protein
MLHPSASDFQNAFIRLYIRPEYMLSINYKAHFSYMMGPKLKRGVQ